MIALGTPRLTESLIVGRLDATFNAHLEGVLVSELFALWKPYTLSAQYSLGRP